MAWWCAAAAPRADRSSAPLARLQAAPACAGTWTRHGDPAFGDPEPLDRTGCVAPTALREFLTAVARARFRFITAPTCAAANDRRIVIEAPRRHKRIVTASPCGQPTDPGTAVLGACAQLVTRGGDIPVDALRATCRPPR